METTIINYVQNESYDSNPPMRIFYSAKDKHFDIIFPMQNIERIADCQGEPISLDLKFGCLIISIDSYRLWSLVRECVQTTGCSILH